MSQTETTLTGNQAVARGALRADCAFFATSPTMVTKPMLDEIRQAFGRQPMEGTGHVVARQTLETPDAPEAVRQCVAAAASGAKALAATAGADLTECGRVIGRAQMAEIPIVIVHCQHLAPSDNEPVSRGTAAGFSPRGRGDAGPPATGDGDVTLARHLTWGSIPLPVLAATDPTSSYRLTGRAFDIAQRLHTPVIMLTSQDIALTPQPIDPHLIEPPPTSSGPPTCGPPTCGPGVSPVSAAPTEQRPLEALLKRLVNKITDHHRLLEIVEPDPDPEAETLLISYGLADQAARQAVSLVRQAGARVSHLTIHSLWPIPEHALRRAITPFIRRLLIPELNLGLYANELARVIKAVKIESLPRYDGGLIDPQTIAKRITDWPCG
jgi:2-oxoglutarate ferredoxin oxidoreductase subunit alpha